MQQLPQALAPMANYPQFILCKFVHDPKTGKTNKLPYSPHTAQPFNKEVNWQTDPTQWASAAQVLPLVQSLGDGWGAGFLFTAQDPFFFVDLDNCIVNGQWSQVATDIMAKLPGAAIELSHSKTGAHIFGCYAKMPEHRCKNTALGLEFYHERRFVALTGQVFEGGNIWGDYSAHLPGLIDFYFAPGSGPREVEWRDEADEKYTSKLSDDDLIAKARQSKGAAALFGGVSFEDLWTGNAVALAKRWPSTKGDPWDGSSADAALAQHLAFWTGNNPQRIAGIMEQSALVRDKWDARENYLQDTITKACAMQTKFYSQKAEEATPLEAIDASLVLEPQRRAGDQFMPLDLQREFFDGCVYVASENKIFTPDAGLLKQEQFNALRGGYSFQVDDANKLKPTRKPWDAFLDSHGIQWPRVHRVCFRPREAPGGVIKKNGRLLVNTYTALPTESREGDVGPFLAHLAKLLPDARDQEIMLSYMAAVIQYKGCKFQWCPFIQGVEGNGKSFFTYVLMECIGEEYSHMPRASEMKEKFNSWAFNKLFIGVEDVYFGGDKDEAMEVIKPMITGSRHERRQMQHEGEMQDLCCNWVLNSNHKDAVRKTLNDRRFAPFYTAQQSKADKDRDGIQGDYMVNLYKWANEGGYAYVNHYLSNYAIKGEFNPAVQEGGLAHEAPLTSSTQEAITASLGAVEQEILESIDQAAEGFRGGWVSSVALSRLLEKIRKDGAIPRNRRRALLQSLGYDYHPNLTDGKSPRRVALDDGLRPRLFIKCGHIHANLADSRAIVDAYMSAQSGGTEEADRLFRNN